MEKKAELQKGEPGAVGDPPSAGSQGCPTPTGGWPGQPQPGTVGTSAGMSHDVRPWVGVRIRPGEGTKVRHSPEMARQGQGDESLLLFQILQKAGCAQEHTG